MTRITDTLLAEHYTLLIISRSIQLRMRDVSVECNTENQNTHFIFSKFFLPNRAVYEIMWKNILRAGQATDDNCVFVSSIACWIQTHNQNI